MRSLAQWIQSVFGKRLPDSARAQPRALAGKNLSTYTADSLAHLRVRMAMHAMLVVAVALLLGKAVESEQLGRLSRADIDIMNILAEQGLLTERINVTAALVTIDSGADLQRVLTLSDTVAQAQAEARRLDDLLREKGLLGPDAHAGFKSAYDTWVDLRGRVWLQTQQVVLWANLQDGAALALALEGLQQEMAPVTVAGDRLLSQASTAAIVRNQAAIDHARAWTAVTLLFLVVIVSLVTELAARSVRRQYLALSSQAAELERLALVAEHTSNGVAINGADQCIVWVNRAFETQHGYTLAELIGQNPGQLLQAVLSDAQATTQADHFKADRGVTGERRMTNKDGSERWFDVDIQPYRDSSGGLAGWISVHTDITEQVTRRNKMATLLNVLPAGVVVQAPNGAIIECNPVGLGMLNLDVDNSVPVALDGSSVQPDKLTAEVDIATLPIAVWPAMRTLHGGVGVRGELVGVEGLGGDMRWLSVNTELLLDAQHVVSGVVSCFVDITESRSQQQLLALALDGAALGSWTIDLVTGKVGCNDRLLGIIGQPRANLTMSVKTWWGIIHPDDAAMWRTAIRTHLADQNQPVGQELRLKHRDGQYIWTLFRGTVVQRNAEGVALRMAGICMDINSQKQLEAQLRDSARTDELTLMPNRAVVMEQVTQMIERSKASPGYNFAVMFMDFDRFKQVNDTLGHGVGDELLRQIAQRLQHSLRPGDAFTQSSDFSQMAARMGGDEFVVVLDDIRGDLDAEVVADRLVDVLAQPYTIGVHTVNSSVSIGIVTSTHAGADVDTVLRDADIAMYEAKRAGRGRYVMFEPSMHKRTSDSVALENDLRQALAKEELFVVYQPLVDMITGKLAGLEALVRWRHPVRGLVSPVEFIPIAEAVGLIGPIGLFVLRTACGEFAKLSLLLGAAASPSVAVNLSRAQLRDTGMADAVLAVMREFGIRPEQLILEVTESLAAQDQVVQSTLHSIKALGVALSLDDFGTGYSSLSCLHELPVSTVKIDRSFVSQAQSSDYHRVLIEATIRMAQTLGLSTVAEGIETTEQADLMRALGCGKGQGYLFSKPLDGEALVAWIKAQTHEAL
jgi:diguanylate cyclase (GGDEF)-like protein/PAS domain S-box-containing protein